MNIIDGKPVLDVAISSENIDALRAKVALFDVLAARIEAGAWAICDTVGGVKILLERTGERVFDVTLAGAVERAMEAERVKEER